MILQLFYKRLKKPILSKKGQDPSANPPPLWRGHCFPEKKLYPSVEDINLKILTDRVKVVGIPGSMPKFEEKR